MDPDQTAPYKLKVSDLGIHFAVENCKIKQQTTKQITSVMKGC